MRLSFSLIRPGRTIEMGSCLLKTGDYKTAVIHLEIASNRLPDFAEARSLLAQA